MFAISTIIGINRMDSVISFLLEKAPWIAVIIIAVFATWKVSKYHHKLEDTNKKVEALPCERHLEHIKETDSRSKKLQETTESNNDMLVEVSKWIMRFDKDMIEKLARKASPLKITPVGDILFDQSHGRKTVDNHLDFLISELEEYNPKTAFDVEEKSLSVLLKNIGHEMFNDVKQYLYYSPESIKIKDPSDLEEKDVELSIQAIIRLMGIYLRDKYLEKHPDIK